MGYSLRRVPALSMFVALLLGCDLLLASSRTIHVAPCGDDDGSGDSQICGSPSGPKQTLQAGLAAAAEGDTVLVAPGVYSGAGNRDLHFPSGRVTLRSSAGPERTLIVAAAGSGRDHAAMILDAPVGGQVLVSGFTISGFAGPAGQGGALRVVGGTPTIERCIFSGNEALTRHADGTRAAAGDGAAARIEAGAPTFRACRFENNLAGGRGGAVFVAGGSPSFVGCRFEANVAGGPAGADDPVQAGAGGAVFVERGRPSFLNCGFLDNEARHGDTPADTGSAIAGGGSPVLINSTVVGDGRSTLLATRGTLTLTNTIVWSGESPAVGPIRGRAVVSYSNVSQPIAGSGNLQQDPRFVDRWGGDLRLDAGSPCIDAGTNHVVPPEVVDDLAGGPRFAGGAVGSGSPRIDIGALEYDGGVPSAPSGFTDCNGNGFDDAIDIATGTSQDCNSNTVPDECDTVPTYTETAITQVADGARTVVPADLDGDGDADVLFGSSNDDTVAWARNTDGAGNFGTPSIITNTANGVRSVTVGDLDGDGDADALAASFNDDTVAWYTNFGDGSFGGKRLISDLVDGASSVIAADLDGDSDLDVAVASGGDDTVAWFENRGLLETFGPRNTISNSADFARSVFAADIDGDGDLDVLSASSNDDTVAWYENLTGIGTFSPEKIITLSADSARSVHADDLDGDGDTDVVSASSSDDKIAWYRNTDGNGNFGGPQVTISTAANSPQMARAVDLDGDAIVDVVVASALDDKISWIPGLGSGLFGAQKTIALGADAAQAVDTADLDGDGDLDVLHASLNDDTVSWHRNEARDCNANQVPDECEPDCDANGIADACDVAAGQDCNTNSVPDACDIASGTSDDCAGNGVPDECEPDCNANATPDSCDIDLGTSQDCDGSDVPDECELAAGGDCNANLVLDICETEVVFVPHVVTSSAFGVSSIFVEDLDGDDDPDILAATLGDDRVAWYENLGSGVFGSAQTISLDTIDPRQVIAPDLDGDFDRDILVGSSGDNSISWFENQGVLGYGPRQIITSFVNGLTSIDSPDLTFDASTDILVASGTDDSVVWFKNDGSGFFGSPMPFTAGLDQPQFLYSGDLDLDGDNDEIVASFNDDTITWFENQHPSETFVAEVVTTSADGVSGLFLKHLTLDPYLDIIAASFNSGKITWYQNLNGTGFGPEQVITTDALGAEFVFAGDLDGDGDTDVVSASSIDDTIAWYENLDSVGSFGPKQVLTDTADGANVVQVRDIDKDGDADVIAASRLDNRIVWWENLSNDCNANGVPDACEADCNANGRADECDVRDGPSQDCDDNGIPDECDIVTSDCNGNSSPDDCDLALGSPDCNGNQLPDECDVASGFSDDCTLNGIPDECEPDCNSNGQADSCDLFEGISEDCSGNGIPDECEPDCDGNGLPDDCDLLAAPDRDCNRNGTIDECETGCSPPTNCDADGDDCQDLLDCDPADGTVWRVPGPVDSLILSAAGGGLTTLEWQATSDPGADVVRYDALRSQNPSNFFVSTVCLVSDQTQLSAQDAGLPTSLYYYLLRVENDCPGGAGSMGTDSAGSPRSGVACP